MAKGASSHKPVDGQSAKPKHGLAPATQKVHVLNEPEVHRRSHKAQRRRRIFTSLSFVLMVLLPIGAVTYYFTSIAADRFAVESKFAIRSPGASAPSDILGFVTSMSSATSTTTDSYMVVDFIESRDLVDRLENRLDLRATYSTPDADPLMRMDPDATKEDIVRYISRVISIYYDNSSQILTLEVQAFTPQDAQVVSSAILAITDDLVNEISERARHDTMRSAERQFAQIKTQLDEHRQLLAAFRQSEQDIDPAASALEQIGLLGGLEREIAAARAQLSSLTKFLNEDAPSVRILKSQIEAMERELKEQRGRLGTGSDSTEPAGPANGTATLTSRVGVYEDLVVDLEFLKHAYFAALATREAAQLEADRAQRYLATFVQPSLPEKSLYPKRVQNILIFSGFVLMLWGIGVILVYIIREHSS